MKKPKILVVGSLVMDLIVTGSRFPEAGETVIGSGFTTAAGGKGANQAVQAARLGAQVTLFGKVGNDDFGKRIIESVADSGVDVSKVLVDSSVPTAVGNVQIQTNEEGTENRIMVVPGANMAITVEEVQVLKDTVSCYDMIILQNEITPQVNEEVAKFAKAAGVPVMLNPAPSGKLSQELLSCLTYISPNEHEAEDIVGFALKTKEDCKAAVEKLKSLGVENVLITLGKEGCAFAQGEQLILSSSVDCGKVVDPTAAGDSFIGAFCTAVASGVDCESALRFANCTAGITVSKMGAQPSLPTKEQVLQIMEKNNECVEKFY